MNLNLNQLLIVTFFGISPSKNHSSLNPSDFNLQYENVAFKSSDGLTLKGWLIKAKEPKGNILLTHGWDSSKDGLLNYSQFLHKSGYNVLMFDFRGYGESDGSYTSLGYYESYDVAGAVNYLKKRPDTANYDTGALGLSMGAAALVMAKKDGAELKAIVLDSLYPTIEQNIARRFKKVYGFPKFPFATSLTFFGGIMNGFNGFDLAPIKFIDNLNVPIFIIQGTKDNQVTIDDANNLYAKAKDSKFIWIVDGAMHTSSHKSNQKEYEEKVVDFFDLYLAKTDTFK